MYLNIIKAIYDKPIVNIKLNSEKFSGARSEQDMDAHSHCTFGIW